MTDINVTNPLNGQVLYPLAEPSPEELQRIWEQARSAQERVAGLSLNQRANAVVRLQHVIHDQKRTYPR
jgi:acyl-CoA reductase-like NAD-dependent aldehyde dehydrogenase